MKLHVPAILDRYARKKDRSYSITFVTGLEIGKEERDAIDEMWQTEGHLIFVPNDEDVIVPTTKAETGLKSPTQILTGRMYVAYSKKKAEGKTTLSFEEWRRNQLESIGNQYLESLD